MESVGIACQSIACLFAILEVAILLFVNKEHSHNKIVLAFLLLTLFILNLNGVLFHTGWYLEYPAFHKIAVPLSLLVSPFAYLYTRSILSGDLRFRAIDWVLLLPTFLILLNFLPYYLIPIVEKKEYLAGYYKSSKLRSSDGEGFLPGYFLAYIRAGWSLLLIILNVGQIKKFKKNAAEKVLTDNKELLRWLSWLNKILAVLLLAAVVAAIIAPFKQTIFNILDIALGFLVLFICLKLFTHPKILYGIYEPTPLIPLAIDKIPNEIPATEKPLAESTVDSKDINEHIGDSLGEPDKARYKKSLENYFNVHKPFLNPDYSLEHLVEDIKIPRYLLSAFINREYNMGFREFINRRRIDYFKANLKKLDWENLTLEAIAEQCGFSSRTTFIKNFKEITGQTPSEYVKGTQL